MSAEQTGPGQPGPEQTGPVGEPEDGAPRPLRSARHQFASTILVLEAFVVVFATLTGYGLRLAPGSVLWGVGGALVLSLVLAAGMLRWPGGYVVGSVLQVAVLLTGLALPMMFVVGGIFVVLWVVALRLGGRIDRERRERGQLVTGS
ncbi:DUF4233 domain-containing protein [Actinotalea soli]|uniref:DUF4233 domain-containing protein n=1 Tax=Actinotalea soli TaxID=2819234 RepID=UPI0027DD99F9|nr:DUF4233 domain-containing protein [Actinotalea soli]